LIETLAAHDGNYFVRNKGRHFSRAFHAEEVGLVLYRDGLFLANWVQRIEASSSEGEFTEIAVEFRPEEVGSESGDYFL
jgi:hypothetical protein